MASLDLITIGRSSVDLYGAQIGGRLEDMGSFDKYIGGSPTNIACGTSRLGLRSAVITGVGDEHIVLSDNRDQVSVYLILFLLRKKRLYEGEPSVNQSRLPEELDYKLKFSMQNR